ncbi:MAG: GNAT family N-acetyltransferase [Siphonobacter aquaeclarae]|jgi:GNAT superfamily N-acetyltransferase|nr:GNAT family N-acetyltransferase [Siphonobacter aquaeclarae]
MEFTLARTREDVEQIHALMYANVLSGITPEEANDQGFVTFQYDLGTLWELNRQAPHVIARDGDRLAGYALTALPEAVAHLPMFVPFLNTLATLSYKGNPLKESRFYLMGQVCVAKDYRGRGVFDGLYQHHRETYRDRFDYLITDISIRNTRSQAAHQRVGFQTIHTFEDTSETKDVWRIVLWEF